MATVRAISVARQTVHLVGIGGYNSAAGGEVVFDLIERHRPSVVLMESFAVDAEVRSGEVLPYRQELHGVGLQRAEQLVTQREFRQAWSAESVAVLAALRVGAEVRFGDRLHTTTCDRIVGRFDLDNFKRQLISATEGISTELVHRAMEAATRGQKQEEQLEQLEGASGLLPQNLLCQYFDELWGERHELMSMLAHQSAEELTRSFGGSDGGGNDTQGGVVLVVGNEHVPFVEQRLDQPVVSSAEKRISDLLLSPATQAPGKSDQLGQAEMEDLEKRAALAALLICTRSFPPQVVLPAPEEMHENMRDFVSDKFPRYRGAFEGRLAEAHAGIGR